MFLDLIFNMLSFRLFDWIYLLLWFNLLQLLINLKIIIISFYIFRSSIWIEQFFLVTHVCLFQNLQLNLIIIKDINISEWILLWFKIFLLIYLIYWFPCRRNAGCKLIFMISSLNFLGIFYPFIEKIVEFRILIKIVDR